MYSLIFLGLTSAMLSLGATPLVRHLALRFGIVDHPDQQRKIHLVPIPRMGGVAIFLSVLCAYGLLLAVRLSSGQIVWDNLPLVVELAPAFVVIFGVGLADDILTLRPWMKLSGELVAAVYAWYAGIRIHAIAGYPFDGLSSVILTIFWIVLCTNAINLIDGVDGLAAGVSLFASLTMLGASFLNHNYPMALAVVPLAGALLGLLRYNYHPASIFLGDSGSLTIGFLLGCFGAVWSEKSTTLLGLVAPLLVMAVPILDVCVTIARRFLRRQPIFRADRAHIHHKLLALGLAPKAVVLVIYSSCIIGSIAALLLTASHGHYHGFTIILICLAAWLGLQQLGYSEFNIAGKMVLNGTFRRVLCSRLALEQFEREIGASRTDLQCWETLCEICPQFGFSGATGVLDDVAYRWGLSAGWQAHINLPGHGYINLWRDADAKGHGADAVLFIDSVELIFQQRLAPRESLSEGVGTYV